LIGIINHVISAAETTKWHADLCSVDALLFSVVCFTMLEVAPSTLLHILGLIESWKGFAKSLAFLDFGAAEENLSSSMGIVNFRTKVESGICRREDRSATAISRDGTKLLL
jgi:hypothetical protein